MSKAFDAMNLFAAQLERHITEKVVLLPTALDEAGVTVRVSMRKTYLSNERNAPRKTRVVKMRLAVEGSVEAQEGLKLALNAMEEIDAYLDNIQSIRLEDAEGIPIPDTRFTETISEDDSFLPSPDSTNVQDALDERLITLYLSDSVEL